MRSLSKSRWDARRQPLAGPETDAMAYLGRRPSSGWPTTRYFVNWSWRGFTCESTSGIRKVSPTLINSGLTTLAIQNDESVLDARKPFEPFGASPAVGSRFLLGHSELVQQARRSLADFGGWAFCQPQGELCRLRRGEGWQIRDLDQRSDRGVEQTLASKHQQQKFRYSPTPDQGRAARNHNRIARRRRKRIKFISTTE